MVAHSPSTPTLASWLRLECDSSLRVRGRHRGRSLDDLGWACPPGQGQCERRGHHLPRHRPGAQHRRRGRASCARPGIPAGNGSTQWVPIGVPPCATGAVLSLTRASQTQDVGQTATVTANLSACGTPLPGATVDFAVSSGPNAGTTGSGVTDPSGNAGLTALNGTLMARGSYWLIARWRVEVGIPLRRRACLEAGRGQWARWSTARDERAGPLASVCYASGADATGYPHP